MSLLAKMNEAEDRGYDGDYFTSTSPESRLFSRDGYIQSSPPQNRNAVYRSSSTDSEREPEFEPDYPKPLNNGKGKARRQHSDTFEDTSRAEVVVFDYGVTVFMGMEESQEKAILEDFQRAGIWVRGRPEEDWEVEECHYVVSKILPMTVMSYQHAAILVRLHDHLSTDL
jgi:uncharacterized Rmd1/YagE family protein